jgi:heme-degrading monooxygenase HmoA
MYELAQFNLARLAIEVDDPVLQSFFDAVAPVEAQAETTNGYLWRDQYFGQLLQPGPFADDELATMTMWTSVESLRGFTYSGAHREAFLARRSWFVKPKPPSMVLWWLPAGTRPTPDNALQKLAALAADGPTPAAFSFAQTFPPPEH